MAKRVKPIKLTLAEHSLLLNLVEGLIPKVTERTSDHRLLSQTLTKLSEAVADNQIAGIAAGPMEQLIMSHGRGKVAKMLTGSAYSRASQLLTKLEATEQDMVDLGQWLARQGWISGTMTLVSILGKWDEWLPRARAEKRNAAPSGFGDNGEFETKDDGPGVAGKCSTSPSGRRPKSGW